MSMSIESGQASVASAHNKTVVARTEVAPPPEKPATDTRSDSPAQQQKAEAPVRQEPMQKEVAEQKETARNLDKAADTAGQGNNIIEAMLNNE